MSTIKRSSIVGDCVVGVDLAEGKDITVVLTIVSKECEDLPVECEKCVHENNLTHTGAFVMCHSYDEEGCRIRELKGKTNDRFIKRLDGLFLSHLYRYYFYSQF